MVEKLVRILRAGRLRYGAGLQLQNQVLERVKSGELGNTLILLEHDPVYTVGLRDKHYLSDEEKLKSLGADFHKTNRGGLITFHGPGQLVAYPIIDLKQFKPSVRWYICNLEETIIQLCQHYKLKAHRSIHTGVWVNDAKVCAMGVHAGRFLTTHGLALNCNVDLTWFSHIVPCGIPDKGVTSLTELLQRDISVDQCLPHFLTAFQQVFNVKCIEMGQEQSETLLKS